jgi:hypothetical protein
MNFHRTMLGSSNAVAMDAAHRHRRRLASTALLGLLCSSVSVTAYGSDCQVDVAWWGAGKHTPATMTVKSGVSCTHQVHTANVAVKYLSIQIPPKNGTATTLGTDKWSYQSNPGFTGADSFEVSITTRTKPALIDVDVTVTK